MPNWPSTLPQSPLAGSLKETPPDVILRTSMGVGPDKVRQRYTAGVRPMSMGFVLSTAQVAILDEFFVEDLEYGVNTFTFVHPRTSVSGTWRMKQPSYAQQSKNAWGVTLEVELLP